MEYSKWRMIESFSQSRNEARRLNLTTSIRHCTGVPNPSKVCKRNKRQVLKKICKISQIANINSYGKLDHIHRKVLRN